MRKEKHWIDKRPNKQSQAVSLKNIDHLKNMLWIQSSYHKIVTSWIGEGRRAHWMLLRKALAEAPVHDRFALKLVTSFQKGSQISAVKT